MSNKSNVKGKVQVSDEQKFVYHDSFNKGHTQIPSMIATCVGLSNNAKSVYMFISRHVFEKGQSAFPSVHRIAFACDCSVKSAINYVDELVDKGFICKEHRGKGLSNIYYINECKDVPLLRVSEMFWEIVSDLQRKFNWKQLFPSKDKVLKFMSKVGYDIQDIEVNEESKESLKQLLIHVIKGGELEVGLLPKNKKFIADISPTTPKQQGVSDRPKAPQKRGSDLGVVKSHWRMLDVSEWDVKQFKEYFYDKYLDVVEHVHPRNEKKHTGQLRRVLQNLQGDKDTLKEYIDKSFEIGYDVVTLDYFCSANRIGEVQAYITTGKKPFYLTKGKSQADPTPQESKTEYKGLSVDKFNKLLDGGE